jgi:hypothetical protein
MRAARQALAEGLVDCLGDPDPALRDGLAYEGLAHWIARETARTRWIARPARQALSGASRKTIRMDFETLRRTGVGRKSRAPIAFRLDDAGGAHRYGRRAADYLASVTDYRGTDDKEGWRTASRMAADWVLQLSLNPALERPEMDRLLTAIAAQAGAHDAPCLRLRRTGSPGASRARLAQRDVYTPAEWAGVAGSAHAQLGDAKLAYADAGWLRATPRSARVPHRAVPRSGSLRRREAAGAGKTPVVAALKTVP